jgi:hypothetical protein
MAVRCRAGAQLFSIVTGVPVLRNGMKNAASRPGHETPSLPGLTRQSILFERVLRRVMDTRVKPAYDAEYVAASCSNSSSRSQTAKLPYSRGAMRPRFASPSQTARGDGAVGGARAPMGTLGGRINVPTSRGKAPRAARHLARQGTARAQGKAQRLPALHRPPGHRPFRGTPVRPSRSVR